MPERKNQTFVEMTRSMLKGKIIPKTFWVEPIAKSIYLLNRFPTRSVQNMTSYEPWSKIKPCVAYLKVFG